MVKVIVVNGRPGCGKTTFETICKNLIEEKGYGFLQEDKFTYVEIVSTVDFVKDIAKQCGWDGTKTLKNRKFLSDLKDLLTEWDNIPFKKIKEKIDMKAYHNFFDTIFFVDCREPAEIHKLKETFNAITLLIQRPQIENIKTSNHADEEVFNYEYSLTITNDEGLEELKEKAENFIEFIKGVKPYEYNEQ